MAVRTRLDMFGTLSPEHKGDWKKPISSLVLAYNSTKHETFFIWTLNVLSDVRKTRLPVDITLGVGSRSTEKAGKFIQVLRPRLEGSSKPVTGRTKVKKELQKSHYDHRDRVDTVEVGDHVWMWPHKQAVRWQEEVHCVLSQPNSQDTRVWGSSQTGGSSPHFTEICYFRYWTCGMSLLGKNSYPNLESTHDK